MRVLIVEDNAYIAIMMEEDVEQAGHEVIGVCASAVYARSLLEVTECDCVLLDCDLADGTIDPAFTRYLGNRGIKPVFVTGQKQYALQLQDQAIGMLVKPVASHDLAAVLAGIDRLIKGQTPIWPASFYDFENG